MKHLLPIRRGIDTMQTQLELRRNPQLWDKHPERTEDNSSPHREVEDIWVRFAGSYAEGGAPHFSLWYDSADTLPSVKRHARDILHLVGGDALGGVLITRIPAGKQVYPHIDKGWHAEYYDKFLLVLEGHQQQLFCFEDGQHSSPTGDLFWFHNQQSHWVLNESPVDRISLIVCVKMDKPFGGV